MSAVGDGGLIGTNKSSQQLASETTGDWRVLSPLSPASVHLLPRRSHAGPSRSLTHLAGGVMVPDDHPVPRRSRPVPYAPRWRRYGPRRPPGPTPVPPGPSRTSLAALWSQTRLLSGLKWKQLKLSPWYAKSDGQFRGAVIRHAR